MRRQCIGHTAQRDSRARSMLVLLRPAATAKHAMEPRGHGQCHTGIPLHVTGFASYVQWDDQITEIEADI
jgi:hypothetical protein